MPTPEGQITGSEIWTEPAAPEVTENLEEAYDEALEEEETNE